MPSKRNKRQTGSLYEKKAAEFLEKQGLFIEEKNYRCRLGEIDLIAREERYLVFVEVKYRGRECQGNPLEAVNAAKQRTISRVAKRYLLLKYHSLDIPCRFDVVGFEGERLIWIKNAFDYCG